MDLFGGGGAGVTAESGADQWDGAYTLGSDGNWYAAGGSGSSTAGGQTHSSSVSGGTYGYVFAGGGVSGTWKQAGGSDTNYLTLTSSTLNADGTWTTTGTAQSGGDDSASDSYSGAGTYTLPGTPDNGGETATGGGTITESGADSSSDSYSNQFTLGVLGVWVYNGGSSSENAAGFTHFAYVGSGTYSYPTDGGGSVGGVWSQGGGDDSYYSFQAASGGAGQSSQYIQGAVGASPTSSTDGGSADVGGDSYQNSSYSSTGGGVAESGADAWALVYAAHYALGADGSWQVVSGAAAAEDKGFADYSDVKGPNNAVYDDVATWTLNGDGTWALNGGASSLLDLTGRLPSHGPAAPIPLAPGVQAPPSFTRAVAMPGVPSQVPPPPTTLQGAQLVEYDAAGDLTRVTDADGNTTTFTYNAAGQVTSQTDASGATTTYTYDAQGRLASQTDALGRQRVYAYNAAGQVLTETWVNPDGSIADVNAYTYDGAGRLLTATNHEGTYTYTYDAAGRVATQTDPFGLTLTYGYDAAGNRVSVADSLGGLTTSTYNAAGQLTSRTYTGPEVSSPVYVGLTYNDAGQLTTITRSRDADGAAPTSQTFYSYDDAGNITQIVSQDGSGDVLADYQYSYGQGGQGAPPSPSVGGMSAAQVSDLLFSETDNGVTTNYSYDAQGELTGDGTTAETYDAAGNRSGPGYVTGVDNRLLSDGAWAYTYDADGNMVKKVNLSTGETWTYGYDFNNRLTWAEDRQSDGGALIQRVDYQYDVFGNRVEEAVTQDGATTVTRYAYDGRNAWADLDGNHGDALDTRRLYLGGADQPAARISATGDVAWYLTDHLGSVRDIVNDSGVVLDHRDYTAFGVLARETNPSRGDRFGFQGMALSAATGLYHTANREYDPRAGRWTTKDPSGFRGGDANLYRFVGNGPTDATDPTGLFNVEAAAGAGLWGAAVGAVVGACLFPPGGEFVGAAVGGIAAALYEGFAQDGKPTDLGQAAVDGTAIGLVAPEAVYLLAEYAIPAIAAALTAKPEVADEAGTVAEQEQAETQATAPAGMSSAQAVQQGLVNPGGKLQSVLQGIEKEFAADPPNPQQGALQAQIKALEAIGKATQNVGLETGQSIGALPGDGNVVLQNVGGIITTIKPTGEIVITNARGQVILNLLPK